MSDPKFVVTIEIEKVWPEGDAKSVEVMGSYEFDTLDEASGFATILDELANEEQAGLLGCFSISL